MSKLLIVSSVAGLGVLGGLCALGGLCGLGRLQNKCGVPEFIGINKDKISVIIQESSTQFKFRHGGARAVNVYDEDQTMLNKLTPGMISFDLDDTRKIYINCKQIVMVLRYSPTELHFITGENTHQPLKFEDPNAVFNCSQAAKKISKEMDIHYV